MKIKLEGMKIHFNFVMAGYDDEREWERKSRGKFISEFP